MYLTAPRPLPLSYCNYLYISGEEVKFSDGTERTCNKDPLRSLRYLCGMRTSISLLSILLLTASCSKPVLIDREQTVAPGGWSVPDSLEWRFTVSDTAAVYDLFLDITHTLAYPFQNCYVHFHTIFPDGERLDQVVSLELQTAGGPWLGDCGGGNCTLRIPIQQGAYFNRPGEHVLRLEQYMRQDTLPGIEAFRLRVEDTGTRRKV